MKKWLLLISLLNCISLAEKANHKHPPLDKDLFQVWWLGNGQVPVQLFWEQDPWKNNPGNIAKSLKKTDELKQNGITPLLSMMMWGSTFFDSKPGAGRKFSDETAYNAYWSWMNERKHYFVQKPDGQIWSTKYEENDTPKDAWIFPGRVLDEADQKPGVETYADWFAERIASFCEASGFAGYSMADFMDQKPHHDATESDFSTETLKQFEKWSQISLQGQSRQERAEDVIKNHYSRWVDYTADQYGKWYGTILNKIEEKTGEKAIYSLQKHVYPHSSRVHGADAIWMRKHASKEQINYHVEGWSLTFARGVGNGQISAYCGMIGAHLSREPDITRGIFMPMSKFESYPVDKSYTGVDLYFAIDRSEAKNYTPAEKTELQQKMMVGGWLAFGWTHLTARSGEVERAGEYFLNHSALKYYPQDTYENIIREIYPVRPYGPGFYYSTTLEHWFENNNPEEKYDPLKAIGEKARTVDKGNFFPGYYVSSTVLESLKPSAYPTAWVTEGVEHLSASEKSKLQSIAPLYDIQDVNDIPMNQIPVRFAGDVTGYSFVDQQDRVVILATRDFVKKKEDITAKVLLNGIKDGSYNAQDLISGKKINFTVKDGTGFFTFPLERWETKAFVTNLPVTNSSSLQISNTSRTPFSWNYFDIMGRINQPYVQNAQNNCIVPIGCNTSSGL